MVPLYEVIQGAQSKKDHAPLVDKAKGIFKNRLCHMKEVSDHVMLPGVSLYTCIVFTCSTLRQTLT